MGIFGVSISPVCYIALIARDINKCYNNRKNRMIAEAILKVR